MSIKNTKYKPLYKKFLGLRENVQNRQKLLQFKRKKWSKFLTFYKKKLKRHKKFKLYNQNMYVVSKRPDRYNSYVNKYKRSVKAAACIRLFLGNIRKHSLNKLVNLTENHGLKNLNQSFLEILEKRLDLIVFRAKFCHSVRNAQQLISHGKVLVNKKIVRSSSYLVQTGDLISVIPSLKNFKLVESNIRKGEIWPIPPKYLIINYKTMQIIVNDIKHTNISVLFLFNLALEKVLTKHS
uniref:Ribosomal protein S4 n=1 Tax=Proschkinia sp. SZCZR1824 TaxID=2588390 RepID=A0A4Y5SFH8_9STRA|nr:ribosomal protein S4 [Proschkinia sp. SZCZR1824]